MVGREIKEKFPRAECKKGKKVFEVKNLNAGRTETTSPILGVDEKESGRLPVR